MVAIYTMVYVPGPKWGSLFFPYASMRIPKVMILVIHYDDFSQQMALHNWSNNFLLVDMSVGVLGFNSSVAELSLVVPYVLSLL